MPQVIVSPEEQRRFASFLDAEIDAMQQKRRTTMHGFERLKEVWRDQKYHQFEKVFNQSIAELEAFCKAAKVYADYLRAKAARGDAYLGRR
jgi:hypothetical protein